MPFDPATPHRTRSTFLPRRGSLVLDGAEGTVIAVDSGCLWVTLERDPRDIVLAAGMRFNIDRRGRTVVVAEEDSRVRITRRASVSERMVARLTRAVANAMRNGSKRLSRMSVPYV
jgi:predicted RNA-binding protein